MRHGQVKEVPVCRARRARRCRVPPSRRSGGHLTIGQVPGLRRENCLSSCCHLLPPVARASMLASPIDPSCGD